MVNSRRAVIVLALVSLAASGAACARARAETVPDGPPLATPAPPPRVLAPVEAVLVEAPPPLETPAEVAPEVTTERRQVPRPRAAADTQKPPEPAVQPVPAVVAETPVRQPAVNQAEEKKIADVLERAKRDLGNVHYQRLNENGKAQYQDSQRFAELATSEVKNRNYPLAATLADKAATIATELLRQQ